MARHRISGIIITMFLILGLTACGSSNLTEGIKDELLTHTDSYDSSVNFSNSGIGANDYFETGTSGVAEDSSIKSPSYSPESSISDTSQESGVDQGLDKTLSEEKLVYTAELHIEVMDFDEALARIRATVDQFDALIQDESIWDNTPWNYYLESESGAYYSGYKSGHLEIRVPSASYDSFLTSIDGIGHVTRQSSSMDNLTSEYYDISARLDAEKEHLDALKRLYDEATSIEDLLTIQSMIYEIQGDIDSLTTRLQNIDVDVAFSTVYVDIDEVDEYTATESEKEEQGFFERLVDMFIDSWEDFTYFLEKLAEFIIYGIWYFAIIIIAVVAVRRFIKKRKKKKVAPPDNNSDTHTK